MVYLECITFINDPIHLRLRALNEFANEIFRQDIQSNSLAEWILIREYLTHTFFELANIGTDLYRNEKDTRSSRGYAWPSSMEAAV